MPFGLYGSIIGVQQTKHLIFTVKVGGVDGDEHWLGSVRIAEAGQVAGEGGGKRG